jgi:hypothetical protein
MFESIDAAASASSYQDGSAVGAAAGHARSTDDLELVQTAIRGAETVCKLRFVLASGCMISVSQWFASEITFFVRAGCRYDGARGPGVVTHGINRCSLLCEAAHNGVYRKNFGS